jgi:hypothetical protein
VVVDVVDVELAVVEVVVDVDGPTETVVPSPGPHAAANNTPTIKAVPRMLLLITTIGAVEWPVSSEPIASAASRALARGCGKLSLVGAEICRPHRFVTE